MDKDKRTTPIPYPALDGWYVTLEAKLEKILMDYLTSNYDQSTVFMGQIRSFSYTLAQTGHSPYLCAETVREDISILLNRYMRKASVEVTHKDIVEGGTGYALYIDIKVSDFGSESLKSKRLLETDGQSILRFMTANNDGEYIDDYYKFT